MSMNLAIVVGNLGQDPDIGETRAGKRYAKLSIATSETWKNKDGERQEETEWHKVSVFGDGLVGVIEKHVKKGTKVSVQGKLKTSKWTDDKGIDRWSTNIIVGGFGTRFGLEGGGQSNREPQSSETSEPGGQGAVPSSADFDDEIPFNKEWR